LVQNSATSPLLGRRTDTVCPEILLPEDAIGVSSEDCDSRLDWYLIRAPGAGALRPVGGSLKRLPILEWARLIAEASTNRRTTVHQVRSARIFEAKTFEDGANS
jgi:hypothetical protein